MSGRGRAWILFFLAIGCKKGGGIAPDPGASSATASASAVPEKPKPWYQGTWSGAYQVALHRVELPAGGVREWKTDDGGVASGPGTIQIDVDAEGSASGKAEGALGTLQVRGLADDEGLRLELLPASKPEPGAFRGVLVATREDDKLRGTLRASTGDSLVVRAAEIELHRGQP